MLNSPETGWVSVSDLSAIFPVGKLLKHTFSIKKIDWIEQSSYIEYRVVFYPDPDSVTIEYIGTEWHEWDGRNFTFQDLALLRGTIVIQRSDINSNNQINLLELINKSFPMDSSKSKKPRLDWLSRKVKNQIRRAMG